MRITRHPQVISSIVSRGIFYDCIAVYYDHFILTHNCTVDGWPSNLVPCSYTMDWQLSCHCSLHRTYQPPSLWYLEWWQEAGGTLRWSFRSPEEENKCCALCCNRWWTAKTSQTLSQGVLSVTICSNHSINFGCILCSSIDAGIQLPASLVVCRSMYIYAHYWKCRTWPRTERRKKCASLYT